MFLLLFAVPAQGLRELFPVLELDAQLVTYKTRTIPLVVFIPVALVMWNPGVAAPAVIFAAMGALILFASLVPAIA